MTDRINPPEPYYIPGYEGYVPRKTFMCGDTFGYATHKVILDPSVNMAERMILSDRSLDGIQALRPRNLRRKELKDDPIYIHPMTPGYTGYIPQLINKLGKRYTVLATESLCDFVSQQKNHSTNQQKEVSSSRYPLPLRKVNPQDIGVGREVPIPKTPPPLQRVVSPYFSDYTDPEKYFKNGYCGFVPCLRSKFGQTNQAMNIEALNEFTRFFRRRLTNYWLNYDGEEEKDDRFVKKTKRYHKGGVVPTYAGHIPGSVFRHGRTIGEDSRVAMRWLKGDFSV